MQEPRNAYIHWTRYLNFKVFACLDLRRFLDPGCKVHVVSLCIYNVCVNGSAAFCLYAQGCGVYVYVNIAALSFGPFLKQRSWEMNFWSLLYQLHSLFATLYFRKLLKLTMIFMCVAYKCTCI